MNRNRLSLYTLCAAIGVLILFSPAQSQAQATNSGGQVTTAAQARALPWFASLPQGWHEIPAKQCVDIAVACVGGPDDASVSVTPFGYSDSSKRLLDTFPGAHVEMDARYNTVKAPGDLYTYATDFRRMSDGSLCRFVVARHDRNGTSLVFVYKAPEPVFAKHYPAAMGILDHSINGKMETLARLEESERGRSTATVPSPRVTPEERSPAHTFKDLTPAEDPTWSPSDQSRSPGTTKTQALQDQASLTGIYRGSFRMDRKESDGPATFEQVVYLVLLPDGNCTTPVLPATGLGADAVTTVRPTERCTFSMRDDQLTVTLASGQTVRAQRSPNGFQFPDGILRGPLPKENGLRIVGAYEYEGSTMIQTHIRLGVVPAAKFYFAADGSFASGDGRGGRYGIDNNTLTLNYSDSGEPSSRKLTFFIDRAADRTIRAINLNGLSYPGHACVDCQPRR
jgi:hypothetical protein